MKIKFIIPSPSTRRAWIEIGGRVGLSCGDRVALHPEGVDRNESPEDIRVRISNVALHPEGVDRNEHRNADFTALNGRPPPGGRG